MTAKKYQWLIVDNNGIHNIISCNRKLMAARELELRNKDKNKLDIIELLTIKFLSFNNISDELTYIL